VGPENPSYLRLNSFVTNPLPHQVELNIAVRSMVDGNFGSFGPACRFMIDTSPANAPVSQLVDDTNDPKHSCGIAVQLDAGQRIWAQAYSGVTNYQFRFQAPGYNRTIASSGSSLMMTTWHTAPLQSGKTYDVDVRLSFDDAATYGQWGPVCTIAVLAPPAMEEPDTRSADLVTDARMQLWPVPNRGDVLNIVADGLLSTGDRMEMEIHDMQGRLVLARTLSTMDGSLRSVVELNGRLASGQYLVSLRSNEQRLVERLVVE
jgi:hypothetical protein